MRTPLVTAASVFFILTHAGPASAREPWQLGHGPFVTAADVREHNQLPFDIAALRALIAVDKPDWAGALALYAFGKSFRAHSLGRFADDYNGRLTAHMPAATRHHGAPTFQNAFLFSALAGTGRFAPASERVRRAAIEAGAVALMINWSRYELGEAARKAATAPANWSLQNGAPKNWNEVFAFYWGPDGRHSVFESLAAVDGATAINDRLLAALAEGQAELLAQKWPADAARKLTSSLHAASLSLLRNALAGTSGASDQELAVAHARVAGFWLAAVEPVAAVDPARAKTIEATLAGRPSRAALDAVRGALDGLPQD
jgi:Low iron-inducible periplasmic protein